MKKIIKIAALILALICIGTSLASCGGDSSIGGGLIPEADKSKNIGVGARVYVHGKDLSGLTPSVDFTVDKTTNSTEEFLAVFENLSAPQKKSCIFEKAAIEEGNCLRIDLGILNGYSPYELHISITLPEKIKKVTLTCCDDVGFPFRGDVYTNIGTISENKKTFSIVGDYNRGMTSPLDDKFLYGTLRIYY